MKLVYKGIDKNGSGQIALIAERPEDMWHAYNLIGIDDEVRSTTIRRVTQETATGSTSTQRVHTMLKVSVKGIHFDTHASVLSIKGVNIEENAYVKMGAYHTIDLELNRKFTILKREWDSVALDRIDEACDPAQNADLAAIVMQEGLAHLCLVLASMTMVKAKIETHIPRKRKGLTGQHDKGLDRFFERIVQAIQMHVNFDIVKAVIVASPGFLKDQFMQFLFDYASKNTIKLLLENKQKFVAVHSSSGFKHSLTDILHDPILQSRLNDTKAMGEVKCMDAFYTMLKNEPSRAYYGVKHIEKANEADAIDTLLVVDTLFRSKNVSERKRYVKIVDSVRDNNGVIKIFSSLHVSGEQLMQLTGIAAILRFPMPDLDDEPVSDDEDDDDMAKANNNNNIQSDPVNNFDNNEFSDNEDDIASDYGDVVTSKNNKDSSDPIFVNKNAAIPAAIPTVSHIKNAKTASAKPPQKTNATTAATKAKTTKYADYNSASKGASAYSRKHQDDDYGGGDDYDDFYDDY